MTSLRTRDIIALGFMTFALFIGAGNIIFPPIVAQQAGEHVWLAAFGFLITAVGLPVITIIALSRVEGSIQILSSPLGKAASLLLTVVCYLTVDLYSQRHVLPPFLMKLVSPLILAMSQVIC